MRSSTCRFALDSASTYPLLFGRIVCFAGIEAEEDESTADPSTGDVEQPAAKTPTPQYKWIHVATEGLYKGHWQGAFDLTAEVLQRFVENLHEDPRYTPGEITVEGKKIKAGIKPVVQFDYEHASEYPPTEGTIPASGAPAPAWVMDLQVRKNKAGKATLWALAKLGKQIRRQIDDDEYRWVSISFTLKGTHWETDEDIGPLISSIAFTNHPFLKNLESYAAANRAAGQPGRREIQPEASSTAPDDPTEGQSSMSTGATNDTTARERDFRIRICRALGVSQLLDDGGIEQAAAETGSKAKGLQGVLDALGVSDAGDALKKLPELTAALATLDEVRNELAEALQGQVAVDEQVATADVAAVMSARKWTDKVQEKGLNAYRAVCIETEIKKLGDKPKARELAKARNAGREIFLGEYGVRIDAVTSHLGTRVLAAPGGVQLPAPRAAAPAPAPAGAAVLPLDDRNADGNAIDLRSVRGRNPTERVIAHLTATRPGFDKLSWLDKCRAAAVVQESTELILS